MGTDGWLSARAARREALAMVATDSGERRSRRAARDPWLMCSPPRAEPACRCLLFEWSGAPSTTRISRCRVGINLGVVLIRSRLCRLAKAVDTPAVE